MRDSYDHTQRSPLHYLLYIFAAWLIVIAWFAGDEPVGLAICVGIAALMFLLSLMFRYLRVCDEGDMLRVHFGPLPLFGTRFSYRDITNIERIRSTWLDGWGVHWKPGNGWIYNIWGFDCVKVTLGDKKVRIGTDDAEGLINFLEMKRN